jgi:branched-chain amino acid transport system substrate-binding protein
VNERLTRREALVAAIAAAALGGEALARPRPARAAVSAKVGVILPLSKSTDSGPANNVLKSARLWADWVNGRGGVDGQHVVLQVYDTMANPDGAAKTMARAITKDGCAVILGGYNTTEALAEIEVAHQYRVPMLVSYAWSSQVTKANYPEVVRIGPNNDILANAFAPFMSKQHYGRVAVMAEDTAFGQGLGEAIRATATLAGIDMNEQTFRRDTRDLRPTLKKVLPGEPDAIVVVGSGRDGPARYLGVTQTRSAGYKGDIVLGWDYVDEAFWKATGKLGVGAIWPTFSSPTLHLTSAGQTFRHAFTKKYHHQPLIYQAFTWDQLGAWKWAVETAGSVVPADVIPVLPRIDMQGTMGRITLSNKPGTVHFNQWEGVTVYFDQATKKGATDSNARVIATIKGHAP